MAAFDRKPPEEKEMLMATLCRRHGWPRERAVKELEELDEIALAYIKVDERLAQKSGMGYDPFQDMFVVK